MSQDPRRSNSPDSTASFCGAEPKVVNLGPDPVVTMSSVAKREPIWVVCKDCNATGETPEGKCLTCDGKGELPV